jgi:methylenetetrahydrofolate reductase (NADPH)
VIWLAICTKSSEIKAMHIQDIFQRDQTTFSFEFFPPKSPEASESLYKTITDLVPLRPSFVSVTYGAGGSTRELTHDLVVRLKEKSELDPIPHLTCVCHKEADIQSVLERYADAGVSNILALGGDPPRDLPNYDRANDDFVHAADLVKFIRKFNESGRHPDKRGFGIGVAGFPEGHPATPNRLLEMDYLKAKVDCGADYIVTQLFFDNRDFLDFRDRCELAGIKVPIIAGIMPITSLAGMKRMAELAAGARFPARLLRALQRCGADPTAVENIGVHFAAEQCLDLLENGVRGIHFYTLNRSDATRRIYEQIGLRTGRLAGAMA